MSTETNTAALGEAYYTALGSKDIEAVKGCLHPDVIFTDPQEKVIGREAVLRAAKGFSSIFESLTIRAKFGSDSQAMIVYDVVIPGLAKTLEAASLLSFRDGKISGIQLFYDTKAISG